MTTSKRRLKKQVTFENSAEVLCESGVIPLEPDGNRYLSASDVQGEQRISVRRSKELGMTEALLMNKRHKSSSDVVSEENSGERKCKTSP